MSRPMLYAWWFLWQAWTASPFGPPLDQLWQFKAAAMAGPFADQLQCEDQRRQFTQAQSRPYSLVIAAECWDSWQRPVGTP